MQSKSSHTARWLLLGLAGGIGYMLFARQRPFYSFRDKVVVLTGGSRGLGLVLARALASEGARLALLSRSVGELERAEQELRQRGAALLTLPCDVRKQDQVDSSIRRVADLFGQIDVLINNAGIIQVGPLETMTVEDFEDAMAVHLFGPLYTTLAALPYMLRSGGGRIVNISSIGGKIAVPHLLPYCASKFALSGFSEGLGAELRRKNIRVTTVYPALMRTGSPPNALFKGQHEKEYAWFAISDALPLLSMRAERAAKRIISACRRGSPRLALGIHTKAAMLLNDLFPGGVSALLSAVNRMLPSPAPGTGAQSRLGRESASWMAPSLLTRLSDQATARNNE